MNTLQKLFLRSKVKNAQEAHAAIRPTLPLRSPDVIASEVNARELALYKIIWQRTLASQMADATGTTVTIKLGTNTIGAVKADCEFSTSGTTITFAGYRQAYQEVEEDSESEEKEALLPPMKVGDKIKIDKYSANGKLLDPIPLKIQFPISSPPENAVSYQQNPVSYQPPPQNRILAVTERNSVRAVADCAV